MRKLIRYAILALVLVGGFFLAFWPGPAARRRDRPEPPRSRPGGNDGRRPRTGRRPRNHRSSCGGGPGRHRGLSRRAGIPAVLHVDLEERRGRDGSYGGARAGDDSRARGGRITLRVQALGTGAWLRRPRATIDELPLPVRLTAPQLAVTSHQNYAAQGGSGIVVYRVAASVLEKGGLHGVEAGGSFFPGLPAPGGGESERFALYGVPYDMTSAERRSGSSPRTPSATGPRSRSSSATSPVP